MWLMVRVAFWISIVLLLLPATPSPEIAQPHRDSAPALADALAAVSDRRQFCVGQPNACVIGSKIVVFGQKPQLRAKGIDETGLRRGHGEPLNDLHRNQHGRKIARDTLTIVDRAEPWV